MNIKKILKFYLILTLTITGLSLLSYSDVIKNYTSHYYADVLDSMDNWWGNSDYKYLQGKNEAYLPDDSRNSSRRNFSDIKNVSANLNFSISNDSKNAYALPGTKLVEIMSLNFKTQEEPLKLRSVKLKISGVDFGAVERAYLMVGDSVVSNADVSQDYLNFSAIGYDVESNSTASFSIKLDLNPSMKSGQRINLDIESPEDMDIVVDGKSFKVSELYPIQGKYLTIHGQRLNSK